MQKENKSFRESTLQAICMELACERITIQEINKENTLYSPYFTKFQIQRTDKNHHVYYDVYNLNGIADPSNSFEDVYRILFLPVSENWEYFRFMKNAYNSLMKEKYFLSEHEMLVEMISPYKSINQQGYPGKRIPDLMNQKLTFIKDLTQEHLSELKSKEKYGHYASFAKSSFKEASSSSIENITQNYARYFEELIEKFIFLSSEQKKNNIQQLKELFTFNLSPSKNGNNKKKPEKMYFIQRQKNPEDEKKSGIVLIEKNFRSKNNCGHSLQNIINKAISENIGEKSSIIKRQMLSNRTMKLIQGCSQELYTYFKTVPWSEKRQTESIYPFQFHPQCIFFNEEQQHKYYLSKDKMIERKLGLQNQPLSLEQKLMLATPTGDPDIFRLIDQMLHIPNKQSFQTAEEIFYVKIRNLFGLKIISRQLQKNDKTSHSLFQNYNKITRKTQQVDKQEQQNHKNMSGQKQFKDNQFSLEKQKKENNFQNDKSMKKQFLNKNEGLNEKEFISEKQKKKSKKKPYNRQEKIIFLKIAIMAYELEYQRKLFENNQDLISIVESLLWVIHECKFQKIFVETYKQKSQDKKLQIVIGLCQKVQRKYREQKTDLRLDSVNPHNELNLPKSLNFEFFIKTDEEIEVFEQEQIKILDSLSKYAQNDNSAKQKVLCLKVLFRFFNIIRLTYKINKFFELIAKERDNEGQEPFTETYPLRNAWDSRNIEKEYLLSESYSQNQYPIISNIGNDFKQLLNRHNNFFNSNERLMIPKNFSEMVKSKEKDYSAFAENISKQYDQYQALILCFKEKHYCEESFLISKENIDQKYVILNFLMKEIVKDFSQYSKYDILVVQYRLYMMLALRSKHIYHIKHSQKQLEQMLKNHQDLHSSEKIKIMENYNNKFDECIKQFEQNKRKQWKDYQEKQDKERKWKKQKKVQIS